MHKVYLVGAGPGDIGLITLWGLELIQRADVIIYDHLVNRHLLDYSKHKAERIYVGKQASQHELPQQEINKLIVDKSKENNIVVRLKGGDPFIFGRGGEEAEFLFENGIAFEIVPGITSAISAPAYAGIPLTHRLYASTVAFITGHEDNTKEKSAIKWDEIAKGPDTLVFLMGIKNIKKIKDNLIKGGRNPQTPACIIQWGTLPQQKVVTGQLSDIDLIAKLNKIKPPAIIIVGDVIKMRDRLKWFEKRPLFGKKVAITRPLHQSKRLSNLLSEKGANIIYLPTIEIMPIEPNNALTEAIRSIDRYDFIVFTSVNSVSIFIENLFGIGMDIRALHNTKIIPIGEATARLLRSNGIIPDFLPERFVSEGIIDILRGMNIRNKRFLLPRAAQARDIISDYIKSEEGICDTIPLYKTMLPASILPIDERFDIITFTSSSTVNNFIELYGKDALNESIVASIGPVTTDTLKKHNVGVHVEAKRYDIEGLIDAIEGYFKK